MDGGIFATPPPGAWHLTGAETLTVSVDPYPLTMLISAPAKLMQMPQILQAAFYKFRLHESR